MNILDKTMPTRPRLTVSDDHQLHMLHSHHGLALQYQNGEWHLINQHGNPIAVIQPIVDSFEGQLDALSFGRR